MDIESVLASVRTTVEKAATTISNQARSKLSNTLRDLAQSLETPTETAYRAGCGQFESVAIRTCVDLKLYNILADAKDQSLSLDDIAGQSKADRTLVQRLLRHQATRGNIKQTGKNTYAANQRTQNLSLRPVQAIVLYVNEVLDPAVRALPAFLKETNYANPQDNTKTAFNKGHSHEGSCWDWHREHPQSIALFNEFLPIGRELERFFEHYPIEKMSAGCSPDEPLFVDVGGAAGSQTISLHEGLPNLKGRLIVQDLPEVVAMTKYPAGIEGQGHDFFTPQPVKGAKFYYLRTVLHDWPDDKCVEILKNLVPALGPESHILLDESVIPDTDAPWLATHTDLAMMVICAGSERSREQWEDVVARAGLKIEGITPYTPLFRASIIDLVKA